MTGGLVVIETHPVQYRVPVYRTVQQKFGIPVTVVYGSDFSLYAYRDREFGTSLAWDVDLTGGLACEFLSRTKGDGTVEPERLSARGVGPILDRLRPAAVLVTGYSPAFHRQGWRAARRRSHPVLFRGETTDRHQTRHPVVSAARDAALRLAYRSCARILYIGERSRQHYLRLGIDRSRLVFSPYCVDTTPFRTTEDDRRELRLATRRGLGIADDRIVLLFSGKLSRRKGVDLIVPAVRRLPTALRERIVVICAGDGQERAAMLSAAAGEPRVPLHVLGVQRQRDLSGAYHAADLLVLPSRQAETWGLVVNEALHHGVPCLVSDQVGCAPDLIDARTGVVCRADSEEALAGGMVRALELAGRDEVRNWCRAKVAPYGVEAAARGIATAFEAVTTGVEA
ncbi:MAG: glycosyltransferase family 4 protein [Acidobacteriota bacterium]|jgi:glycosyltransferase involved in cell wall biosynthesis|nr:MAG: glycosyltransferase [Acidobacteriota bacterium]